MSDDAGAQAREFAFDALEHIDDPTITLQQQRGDETSNRPPDDNGSFIRT